MHKRLSWVMAAVFSTSAWAQGGMPDAAPYPESGATAPLPAPQQYPELPIGEGEPAYSSQVPSYPAGQSSGSSGGLRSHDRGGPEEAGQRMQRSGASGAAGSDARTGAPAPLAVLNPVTENGFTYLCGGIGSDEAAHMKQAARDYDLMLTFASRKGSYLADIDVEISGQQGKSPGLQARCDAPIMLVDFPQSGSYRIQATAEGKTLTRNTRINAGKGHKAMVMVWAPASGNETGR